MSSTTTGSEALLVPKLWWRNPFLKKKPHNYRISTPAISPGAMSQLFRPLQIRGLSQKATSGLGNREKGRALPSVS